MSTRFEKALGFKPEASNHLYALCDFQTLLKKNLLLSDFIEISKNHNIKLIQYRDKINSIEIQIENLKYLKKYLTCPLIINDKIELIEYADGIHLGQEDLEKIHSSKEVAIKLIRKKVGNKLIGVSTHNEFEILESNELDIDMIGLGAYKSTLTKDVDNILGDRISYLAKISKHPVCAIGGVNIDDDIDNISFNVVGSGLYDN